MGYTRKILSHKKLHPKSVFYTDDLRIDMAESIHLHFRNFRLELSMEEWKTLVWGFWVSWVRWLWRGAPHYQPTSHHWEMFRSKLNPVAGRGKQSVVRGSEFLVELSQFADYIHVHFRNTRYELTVQEFLEVAQEVAKAADEIRVLKILKDYPKRVGFYHNMQPCFRVTPSENLGGFVVHNSRFPDENARTHDSVLWNEEKEKWEQQIEYFDIKPVKPNIVTRVIIRTRMFISKF